jgi:hypothetical protein
MRQNSPEEHQYVSVKREHCMANRTYIELRRMRCAMVVASDHHGEGAGSENESENGKGTALNTEVRPNVNCCLSGDPS